MKTFYEWARSHKAFVKEPWKAIGPMKSSTGILEPSIDKERPSRLLFVCPEAGVSAHYNAMLIVARTLKEMGHDPLFVFCDSVFHQCPAKDLQRVTENFSFLSQRTTCSNCQTHAIESLEAYGLSAVPLSRWMTAELSERLEIETAKCMLNVTNYEWRGEKLGCLALHDAILFYQAFDLSQFTRTQMKYLEMCVRSTLLSRWIFEKILQDLNIKILLTYNHYSILTAAQIAADKANIPSRTVIQASHLNVDRRQFVFLNKDWPTHRRERDPHWPLWRDLSISPKIVREISDDLIEFRFKGRGSHVWSPPKNDRSKNSSVDSGNPIQSLGLDPDRKTLVCYTSSLDEYMADRMVREGRGRILEPPFERPFRSQIEWLTILSDWVSSQNHLQLIIRIHPREMRSRYNFHLTEMRSKLFDRSNVRVVWPEQKISSYDLGEWADVILNSWSSIGLEFARLGAPVIPVFQQVATYLPPEIFPFINDGQHLISRIQHELAQAPEPNEALKRVITCFRWYNYLRLGIAIPLDDVISGSSDLHLPKFQLPRNKDLVERLVVGGEEILDLNRDILIRSQTTESSRRERQAVYSELKRALPLFNPESRLAQRLSHILNHVTETSTE